MRLSIFERTEPIWDKPYSNAQDVYESFRDLAKLDREVFIVCLLNNQNYVIGTECVSIGVADQAIVGPREVMKAIINTSATGVVFVHNHPSSIDDVTPSIADGEITKRLVICARLLEVRVLDHIIVGAGGYYSYNENDMMDDYEMEAQAIISGIVRT
ncbi:MAG: RadC family protein [Candidatus Hodarchaeota archaeon]